MFSVHNFFGRLDMYRGFIRVTLPDSKQKHLAFEFSRRKTFNDLFIFNKDAILLN